MLRTVAAACVSLAALVLAGPASAALRLDRTADGFNGPIYVAAAPGDSGHLYVVEQRGVIKRLNPGSDTRTRFLDIRGLVACCGERGLFSVAFHPRYATNRLFFVNYTRNDGDVVVARFRANDRGTSAVESTRRQRLLVEHSRYSNHNGGTVFFTGRCGLHVSIGDGGSGGDPHNNSQRMANRLGKLVRIDACGGATRVVALGLRNPWRVDHDPDTGLVYIADVGQSRREEISLFRSGTSRFENYGWRRYEGSYLYSSSTGLYQGSTYVAPIRQYRHVDGRCSITGGHVHRDDRIAEAYGRYFYGDFCTGEIWSFRYTTADGVTAARTEDFSLPAGSLVSFGTGPRGGVYVVDRDGVVYRIAAV